MPSLPFSTPTRARSILFGLRMTCNTAEAEDLTQAAFLQAFRKLAGFRGESAISTWLYRVAVNTVLMHFRKKGVPHLSLDEPAHPDEGVGSLRREHGKTDARLAGSVDRIALTRAMKELPIGYRTIFVMHEVEGYEHHEIAQLLGCSIGNSKSQLHKAKAKMRELLGISSRGRSSQNEKIAPNDASDAHTPLRHSIGSECWGQMSELA